MHQKDRAPTEVASAETVTQSGLRIQRVTTPEQTPAMNEHLSWLLRRPVRAGDSIWLFMGPTQQRSAELVGDVVDRMAQSVARVTPDDFGDLDRFRACLVPGDQDGEPFTALVVATLDNYDQDTIGRTERTLIAFANQDLRAKFEHGHLPEEVVLPLPPEGQLLLGS